MNNCLRDRKSLYALSAPFGGYLVALPTPYFFRVGLEEGRVELDAEPSDEKILQRSLLPTGQQDGVHVAGDDAGDLEEAELSQRMEGEVAGALEELSSR